MQVEIPEKLDLLFESHRYKVIYGGRGSSKSWGCARALLIEGLRNKERVLCAREFQNSISDSVHALLSHQIELLGLQGFYEIQNTTIIGKNGTEFIFTGLRHNISKIKSFEGVTKVWVEEAQTVSKASWDVLIPTIRKEDSEIWITFNPELDTDETYKRFVLAPPESASVVKMNWRDNPWFPEVLEQERNDLKERDIDAYLNVWEGNCRQTLDGAIYAKEIRLATEENRIGKFMPNRAKPIETFWDLGHRDHTSIWFAQISQGEYRVLDFYQNRGEKIEHYLLEIQKRGYVYGMHWLPHDATQERLTGLTIERIVRNAYPDKVRILPRTSVLQGINAVRTIFGNCYFDEDRCADGLQALRRYRYDVDENGQFSRDPLHDENSDAADAFRYLAMSLEEKKPKAPIKTVNVSRFQGIQRGQGWLG